MDLQVVCLGCAGLVCLQSRSLWIAITIADWLLLVVPAFLVPRHLYTSQLSSLCRVKPGQDHCVVPWKAGEAHCSPHSSLSGRRNSFWLKVPSWLRTVLAWGMGWCRQNEVVFLLFLCNCSQAFCFTVLLKFLNRTPELSRSCFCLWIACLVVDAGVSKVTILVMSLLQLSFECYSTVKRRNKQNPNLFLSRI